MTHDITIRDRTLTLEIGKYAQQATAAVVARLGDTVVHATVVVGPENPQFTYLPLYVEYQEKLYAGGKIKGSRWVKREGRPSDEAILTSRLIDRSMRPLFPKSLRREIQVIITTLSVDGANDPDIPAIVATSAALSLSGLPFNGPVGAVRIGFVRQNGESGSFVSNPTHQDRGYSDLDLVVSGTRDGIVMVEAGANQVPEQATLDALKFAQADLNTIIDGIAALAEKAGVKSVRVEKEDNAELKKIKSVIRKSYIDDVKTRIRDLATKEGGGSLSQELVDAIAEKEAVEDKTLVTDALDKVITDIVREQILKDGRRPDGRKPDEIRPITCRVRELPRTHGSAMFQRGATQALTIVTLASPSMEQWIESPEAEETKRYIHHYNMPPFSVGEVGRTGWPSRREVGHGALAERALLPVIPSESEFPYTIRVVSEIMSSNGSTSMASVCGSTLSLMDAGVPIKSPVAGIAMGLVTDGSKHVVLSDIMGLEDFKGDMDFKVAGTRDGITALQMDVKIPGVNADVLGAALEQARQGRLFILEKMLAVQPKPNEQISQFAPKISMLTIDKEKIGDVIGPGGKIIKKIIAETGATVDVEDDGTVTVSGMDQQSIQRAVDWIKGLTQDVTVGQEYQGTVVRIVPFGAFVNILPGKDGLIHVSKLSTGFLEHPSQVVSDGDAIAVRVREVDEQGRINLVPVSPLPAPQGTSPSRPLPGRPSHRHDDSRRPRFERSPRSGGLGAPRRKPYYERGR